jgi:hypothetical protein
MNATTTPAEGLGTATDRDRTAALIPVIFALVIPEVLGRVRDSCVWTAREARLIEWALGKVSVVLVSDREVHVVFPNTATGRKLSDTWGTRLIDGTCAFTEDTPVEIHYTQGMISTVNAHTTSYAW